MTASWWMRASSPERHRVDAVVVGAGICGLSAALWLERLGKRVVVLDRVGVGGGASTRNAGFLMRGAAECYAEACRLYGRDNARMLWALTEDNLRGLRAEGIESLGSVQRVPSAIVALEEGELGDLHQSRAWMLEDGFAVGWEEGGSDPVWRSGRAKAALLNPDDAACNPVEVLGLLRSKLSANVIAPAEVVGFTETNGNVAVETAGAVFEAERVLLATNAYLPLLVPARADWVAPRRGQMLALRADGVTLSRSYYANRGSEYFRQARDGTIVVGGFRTPHAAVEVGYEDKTTPTVQAALEGFAREFVAPTFEVVARWSGVMGFSPDGLPVVSRLPGYERVWFAGAFTGHGMSMGYRVAEMAARALWTGEATPFAPRSGWTEGAFTVGSSHP